MTKAAHALIVVAVAGAAFVAGRAGSLSAPAAYGEPPQHDQDATKKPDGSQKQKDMMALAEAGEAHKHLESLLGDWDGEVSVWFAPGKPPMKFKETIKREMLFDQRFIIEHVDAQSAMGPYHGLSILGYNNARKCYEIFFIDNGSTPMNLWTGSFDADKKLFTYTGNEVDTNGKKAAFRTTIDCSQADTQIKAGYKPGKDGKEYKAFEIKMSRKK